MDPDTLLQQLAPLRAPAPISWWPPAPGWWMLAVMLVLLAAVLTTWLWSRHRKRRYRRIALTQLKRLQSSSELSIAELNRILKATALHAWPAEDVAGLHGNQWQAFLTRTDNKLDPSHLGDLGNIYRHPQQTVTPDLLNAASHWIEHHRADTARSLSDELHGKERVDA